MSLLRRFGTTSRRWLPTIALSSCIAIAGAAFAFWQNAVAARASQASLDELVRRCETEMLRGTCRVQSGLLTSSPADTAVFVAGVGAIDAAAYRRLREAGAALCSTVRDTCTRDWAGASCRAARALHGQS